MLTYKAAGTSTTAPAPKVTPAGLMKKKLGALPVLPGSSFSKPLIVDNCPPVTREITLLAGPLIVNTAPSPLPTLNFEKLWKTLPPERCP
ncbi:MAG: hypothetical protein AW09_004352 [Candidatus Accumulibacter phosphatis]|uniref:Uncharacterized protein n=1 Tax=Candidatus Accumulibacter phosphatis TaxID=327160 RepID=A0A080M011_9PROT|nr:MAG: hypothetical protein AW09_004352 [Candidatus Accumulibacter phosphatis]